MNKRILSFLLVLMMALSVFPVTVLAEDGEGVVPESVNEVESTELEEENKEKIQEESESVEKTTEPGEDTADSVKDETEQGEEKTESKAVKAKAKTMKLLNSPAPDGAVAYVTDASGQAVTTGTAGNLSDGYYASLKSAVAAGVGVEGGTTVTLVSDTAISNGNEVTVANGQTVTIDLNGHYVYSNFSGARGSAVISVRGTGVLTIKDSVDITDDGVANGSAGYITTSAKDPDQKDIPGYANNTITCYGTLNLESGYIENNTSSGGRTVRAAVR